MMKLIHIETLPLIGNAAVGFGGSMQSAETRAMSVALHDNGGEAVTDITLVSFGYIVGDDGLIAEQSETLSYNDDHAQSDDLEYLYNEAARLGTPFATLSVWRNDILTNLYFGE